VALKLLAEHSWPGNVRELDHSVERAVLMAQGTQVLASDLNLLGRKESVPHLDEMEIEDVERLLIRKRWHGTTAM